MAPRDQGEREGVDWMIRSEHRHEPSLPWLGDTIGEQFRHSFER